MKLKIFYQVTNLPGWEVLVTERIDKLTSSGLLDNAELYVYLHYDPESYNDLIKSKSHPNIHWVHCDATKEEYEHPTAILMQTHAVDADEPFYALYLHQKGITAVGTDTEQKMAHWRWLMDYWCIENWESCIYQLDNGYNIVGCNLLYDPVVHFSGNQYWAKSEFIASWPKIQLPSTVRFYPQIISPMNFYRYDIEFWYGRQSNLNPYSLFDSNVDHYQQEFPPELYRMDIIK
jgi:hypothetical protein